MPQRSAAQRVAWRKLHREASMLRAACLSAALLACAPALAQNYAGTYTAPNASGGTVMLTLTQDAQSGVSGTLTGYGSSSLQVQARVEAEGLRGTAGNSFGLLYLTGRLNGEELSIVLMESDLGGKPNPQRARELRPAKAQAKTAPQNDRPREALPRNPWRSFTYNITGNPNMERLDFPPTGLVTPTPGKPR